MLKKLKFFINGITIRYNREVTPFPYSVNPISFVTLFTGRQRLFLKRFIKKPDAYRGLFYKGTLSGNINLYSSFSYNPSKEKPRGNFNEEVYSWSYEIEKDEIDPNIVDLVEKHKQGIIDVLGPNFRLNKALFWRNIHIPYDKQYRDFYSNVFHQDNYPDHVCVKLFVLIEDVGHDNGPFEYLSFDEGKKHFKKLRKRSVFKVDTMDVNRVVGERGSFLFINTAFLFHRDSVPNDGKQRTIFQLDFYPDDTGVGVRW